MRAAVIRGCAPFARSANEPRRKIETATRRIVVVCLIIVLAVWTVTVVSLRSERQSLIDRSRSEARNLASAFAADAGEALDRVAASMRVVAEHLRNLPGSLDINALRSRIALLADGTIEVSIIGPDGRLVSTTADPAAAPVDLRDREDVRVHFDQPRSGFFIAKPVLDHAANQPRIRVSRRVNNADGKLLGIIVYSLPPAALVPLHRSIDLGPHGLIGLVGRDGVIRARFTPENPDGLLGVGRSIADAKVPPNLKVENASGDFIRASLVDRVERLFSYRKLEAYPLTAVVGLDLRAALAPARSYGWMVTIITAMATILLCGLVGYLARAIRHRAEREIELSEQRRELMAANNRLQVDVALRREAEQRLRVAQDTLRDAVDSISEAFVIFDADDRLVICNEAYRRLYSDSEPLIDAGARFEELIRDGLARGIYRDAIGREENWLAERIRAHHDPTGVVETPLADGRWVLITDRPMRNGGVAGLRIDITKLKLAEAELRRARDNLNRAQRIARTGSNLRDLATGAMEWSDEAYRIMGVEPGASAPTAETFLHLVVPDDRPKVLWANAQAAAGHCPEPIEYRIRRSDGEVRHIRHEAELVYDKNGEPTAVADVLHDVTELRAAEARQRELEHQLRHSQKLEALGTLAGGIAHDLNNTLSPVLVLSELLLASAPAGSQQQRDLETVLQSARHGRELVRSILGFSRKQEGAIAATDLAATVDETMQMLRATVPANVRLIADIAKVPPVMGNASQLQQAIVNLVNNAVQAIGDNAGTVIVKLFSDDRQAAGDARVFLRVSDNGRGMDADTVQRIFEPFFTTKPVGEGTGLGLSLVHGIVTSHQGHIEVRSEPGMGTDFTVVLPVSQTEAPEIIAAAA